MGTRGWGGTGPMVDRLLGRVRRCPPTQRQEPTRPASCSHGHSGELCPGARACSGQPLGTRSSTPGWHPKEHDTPVPDPLPCRGSLRKGGSNPRPWDTERQAPL